MLNKLRRLFTPYPTDAEIEAAIRANGDEFLLVCALDRGRVGMDPWWRLCEGNWTRDVQRYLPDVTDRGLLAFLKRYVSSTPETVASIAADVNSRKGYVLCGDTWCRREEPRVVDAVDPIAADQGKPTTCA